MEKEPAFTPGDVPALKERGRPAGRNGHSLAAEAITTQEAMAAFCSWGQVDQARLLSWRKTPYFDVYTYGDYMDYFYGRWPSTGYLSVWDLVSDGGTGVQFCFPDSGNPDRGLPVPGAAQLFRSICRERAGATSWAAPRWRISMTWCSRDA